MEQVWQVMDTVYPKKKKNGEISMKRKIFNINGGIGRCIAFTGVIKKFAEKNPNIEINLLTGFPDVFWHNPYINRIYPFHTPYLFEDVILKMDYQEPEPYKKREYYANHKHIIECFNEEINGKTEFVQPEIFLTDAEKFNAKKFIENISKPVILFQPWGSQGGNPKMMDKSFRSLEKSFVQRICDELKNDYEIILVKSPEQEGIEGIKTVKNSLREVIALIPYVHVCVGVDSFLQHACAALKKSCFVFWTSTLKENLGYDLHENIRNNKDFIWTPVRIFMNNPNVESKNKGVNKFGESHIKKLKEWLNEKNKNVKRIRKNSENKCKSCID